MIRLKGSRRVALIAALAVVLTLVGGGGAVAYWSASAQLGASVATAKTGITQTVHPDAGSTPLNVTYSAETRSAAGAVSVQNIGSREATYSIVIGPDESSDLSAAISVAVAPVAAWEACTPEAVLVNPTTGTLGTAGFTATGEVAAGATVILCVQTSMSAGDVTAHADQTTELALGTQLAYADSAAWTLSGMTVTFTQSVGSSLLFDTDGTARYLVSNDGICIVRYADPVLARDPGCNDGIWDAQWRVSQIDGGHFHISAAQNTSTELNAPRWTAAAPTAADPRMRTTAATESDDQRWIIASVASDEYRIESVEYRGLCATIGGPVWGDSRLRLVLTECDNSRVDQRFTFEQIGITGGDPAQMTCTGAQWSLALSFPPNDNYGQEVSYRVDMARASSPDLRMTFDGVPTGSIPTLYVGPTQVASLANSGDGTLGEIILRVEQRVTANGEWNLVAIGKIRSGLNEWGNLNVWCGGH